MPHLRIETNVSNEKIPADFAKRTTALLAKILGKPESYCVVSILGGIQMAWGGSTEPCAIGNLMSIGQLGVEENKKHAKAIYEHVNKELGILPTRMYISFQDVPTSELGYNGTTFHDIFG